eukprot:6850453-Prymnesium_polylepis.1
MHPIAMCYTHTDTRPQHGNSIRAKHTAAIDLRQDTTRLQQFASAQPLCTRGAHAARPVARPATTEG